EPAHQPLLAAARDEDRVRGGDARGGIGGPGMDDVDGAGAEAAEEAVVRGAAADGLDGRGGDHGDVRARSAGVLDECAQHISTPALLALVATDGEDRSGHSRQITLIVPFVIHQCSTPNETAMSLSNRRSVVSPRRRSVTTSR